MNPYSLIVFAVVALHAASAIRGADDAGRLLPHGQRQGGALQPRSRRRSNRCRGRAIRRGRPTTRTSASTSSRSSTRQTGASLYSRGFARSTASGRRPPRRGSMNRTFSESLRFPAVEGPQGRAEEARRDRTRSSDLDADRRSGGQVHRSRRGRRAGRRAHPAADVGDPDEEARSPDPRRRLHRRRTRQVRTRRAPADARAVRDLAVQGARARHQRLGARAARARSRASRGRRTASTGARRSARPTTPSAPSATSSRSTTGRSATSPPTRRTTSSRS